MHDNLQLVLVSLGDGASYAILAVGLVLIFRGSGVLNFGHGAIASFSAYTYLWLAGTHGIPKGVSAVLAVLAGAGIGAVFQLLVMRKLLNAPALARVVATLGLLVALVASIPLVFSDATRPPVPLFPPGTVTLPLGDPKFFIPRDRLYLALAACLATLVVGVVFRFTIFGKATRAVSENQRAVSTLGYSPQRLALVNWTAGSALAGLAGVLLAGLVSQDEISLTRVMIAGFAAALLGGFRSFGVTLAAAFGLSALRALLVRYGADLADATTVTGWGELAPFLVIIVFMTLRGAAIPLRGALLETRLPTVPVVKRPLVTGGTTFVVLAGLYSVVGRGLADAMTVSLLGGIVCLSLVVLVGFLGQVSLVQMALAGVGAFFAAHAATAWDLPFPLPVIIGGLFAVPVGLVAAVPALRVRGINLAVITISAAFALDAAFFTDLRVSSKNTFPEASFLGIDMSGVRHPRTFGVMVLAFAVLIAIGVAYLRSSPVGVRFLAVRANERGAAALGVSLVRTKLLGFAIAAFIAGVAGGLYGYRAETLSYASFDPIASLVVVTFAYLGGIGAIAGAFIGSLMLSGGVFSEVFHFEGTTARVLQVLGGVGAMFTVVMHPDGLYFLSRDIRGHLHLRRGGTGLSSSPPPLPTPAISADMVAAEPGARS